MSAHVDTLYLPVPAPAKVVVRSNLAPQRRRPPQTWQQRLYRIPRPTHVQTGSIGYGADGSLSRAGTTGTLIDIFA